MESTHNERSGTYCKKLLEGANLFGAFKFGLNEFLECFVITHIFQFAVLQQEAQK